MPLTTWYMRVRFLKFVCSVFGNVGITPVWLTGEPEDRIPGQYLVQFKPEAQHEFEQFKQYKSHARSPTGRNKFHVSRADNHIIELCSPLAMLYSGVQYY